MSQLISATSPLPRAPNAKAEPSGEPAGEATAAGDAFAALLAGLFALPVAPTIVAQPATPVLLKGQAPIEALPADALPNDALADQGTADEPANGSGDQEQPLGGDAAPPSIAGSGSVPGGTLAPVANAEVPVAMPPREAMDTPAALPPSDDKPATTPSGEAKAIATSGAAASAAAGQRPSSAAMATSGARASARRPQSRQRAKGLWRRVSGRSRASPRLLSRRIKS